MATARDIVERGLRLLGVLAQGEAASADQLADGLEALNDLLDSWSTENLSLYKYTTENFSFIASQAAYSMGTGLDFNTSRPVRIVNMTYKDETPNPDYEQPIEIVPQEAYKFESSKGTESSIPTKCFVNYDAASVVLTFWPVPSAAKKVSITSLKPLTTFTNGSDAVSLPTGYLRALKTNLAVEMAPEYGLPVSGEVAKSAMESKSNIKRQNKKDIRLKSEVANVVTNRNNWDYRTGE